MLSREEFCKLTGINSVEAMKSRSRRGQLPVAQDGEQRKSHGYSFFDAFLTVLADRLAGPGAGMTASAAAAVARDIAPALAARWVDIITSAAFLDGSDEIEWLHVSHPGEGSTTLVGTIAEVAAQRKDGRPTLDGVSGNATRVAWEMIHQAEKHGISIPEQVWTEAPPVAALGYETTGSLWLRAIDEAAQRKGQ